MAKKAPMGTAKAARRKTRKKRSAITERKKKEFTYKGLTLGELQKLSLTDLMPLLSSRARRTLRRGYNEEQMAFVERLKKSNKPVLKTHRRAIVIIPEFVGKKIAVYNGKEYKEVEIKAEMIGHYIGEFSITRSFSKHSGPGVGATRGSKFMPLK